jgi:hypothetical protein
MIRGQVKQGWQTIRQIACETMKKNRIGFFNSELQRELGKRPKKQRACYARNPFILEALDRGFILQSCISEDVITIGPCECFSLVDVVNKLMLHPRMSVEYENWIKHPNKEKHYLITALTRALTGHIDKKTGKSVYTFKNWRVLGINISIDSFSF